MASIAERLRLALDQKNMKQSELSELTGIGKSSISTYLSGEYEPKQRNIYKMAKVLDVNEAWLMGEDVPQSRTANPAISPAPTLTAKDERDIEKQINAVLEELESGQSDLAFSGEPLDDVTRELLVRSLRNSMEIGKTLAKQKYTPKKYRKE